MELIHRQLNAPDQHFFLLGPRGTGKSTWLHQQFDNALWLDLLDTSTYRSLLAHPERLIDVVEANSAKQHIIIDEVQRIPELLHIVHKIIEEKRDQQFILTGSSARKLKREGVDLLAGRAIIKKMHPFIASELGSKFSVETALQFGLLPVVHSSNTPLESLNAYIHLYLEQEIKAEGLVRNLDQFTRFLEAVSYSHANNLNVSDIARECEVKRTTVVGFIDILFDLLIAWKIPVFSKRAKRALVTHNKFYIFDAGVFRILRPAGFIDRTEEIEGQGLEGLVVQHLQTWIDYSGSDDKIYYWRTRGGAEVDFIVYGSNQFYAIEVKNSSRVRSEDLSGLKSFITDYPECTPVLLYRGKERIKIEGVLCIPVSQYLIEIIPGNPLPL